MTEAQNPARRGGLKRCGWLCAVILALIACAIMFRNLGRWLVVEDALAPSDAIVVLSGGLPYRALEAAKIYRQSMAPQIWITQPANPAEILNKMGIAFTGEESYSRAVLIHEGVPENAIRIIPGELVNTEDEERALISAMQAAGAHRIIVVTSPPHTRRVRALWHKLAPPNLALIVHPAAEDDFDADHWWRTTRDALAVERETMGLVNLWAGLPVRPAASR